MGEEPAKPNEYKKDLTAEEKKAQRSAKAAEKKLRAEAAAAKKAAGGSATTAPQSATKQQPVKEKKAPPTTSEVEVEEQLANIEIVTEGGRDSPPTVKSALKTAPSTGRGNEHEVKFDLTVYASDDHKKPRRGGEDEQEQEEGESCGGGGGETKDIHPAFINLVKMCDNEMIGDVDGLSREFIKACKKMFSDFFSNEFVVAKKYERSEQLLSHQIAFLTESGRWALPPALGNIFRLIRRQLQKIDENLSQEDALEMITDELESLETTHFVNAAAEIAGHLERKIVKIGLIAVYGGNKIVEDLAPILVENKITVTVVDDEWSLTAKKESAALQLAKSLAAKGVFVEFCELRGIAQTIPSAQLVILDASAVFLNGGVSCQKGAAQLTYVAKAFNVPVVCCAQTYKFVDMVHHPGRTVLLRRQNEEIVPPDCVTALITEMRLLPASSAPAVVKSKLG